MICPNCQVDAVIAEQLYGALYTCSSCMSVYFINFEGQPEFGEVPTGVLDEIVSEPLSPEPFVEAPIESEFSPVPTESYESSLEPLIDAIDLVNFDNKLDDQFNSQVETTEEQNLEMSITDDIQNETTSFEPIIKKSNSFTDIAKEISDFGNTEVQLSGLNYELSITGLDTQETMRQFKDAIEDTKFGWDSNELLKSVKNGQIKFERLSPVKAYILAKRLQFLDIERHWKQNAMS